MDKKIFQTTGRRKEASAQVKLKVGSGKFIVNEKTVEEYFRIERLIQMVKLPLTVTSTDNSYDISAKIIGGGITGQSDALKLALSRALTLVNPKYRPILKKQGLLTRDSRIVERKKYGHPKARKRFQFSKR